MLAAGKEMRILADHFFLGVAGDAGESRINRNDFVIRIGYHHGLTHGFEYSGGEPQ